MRKTHCGHFGKHAVTDRKRVDRPVIEPIYSQSKPSQRIELGLVPVEFVHGGKIYQDTAKVSMQFTPNNRLVFVIPDEGKPFLLGLDLMKVWDGKLNLPSRGVTLDALYVGSSGDDGSGLAFVPRWSPVTVTPPSKDIHTAVFHLFNLPPFHGPDDYIIQPSTGSVLCGLVNLRADGWAITIAALENTRDLCGELKRQGTCIVTHMGRIEREDGSAFTSDQLDDILHCMHYFLSFALGRWAGVALPIGFDVTGNRVFEEWGMPIVAPGAWNGTCSWFDDRHAELLPEVFTGFMVLWKDKTWSAAFREALHWYLGANERATGITVEMGLILAQTALELLAWTYCVQSRKMISADAFEPRGLSAADKTRLLASSLGISLDIPATMSALRAKRGSRWQDAADAITGIRNAVVHPRVKKNILHEAYYEAWNLSMWYLDMVFLRLCGHMGKYSNRLRPGRWAGQVESVPWAKTALDKAGKTQ